MSSVSRTSAESPHNSSDNTRFVNITTPSYFDFNLLSIVPIPFSYSKGVLDINIQDNVMTDLVNGGYEPAVFSLNLVRKMGGTGVVKSLGPNLVTYLKNFLAIESYPVTVQNDIQNLTVVGESIVSKIQIPIKGSTEYDLSHNLFNQFGTFSLTDLPPTSDSYLTCGSEEDNFSTCWVFQTPLTIGYTHDDIQGYVTFTTTYTKNLVPCM